MAVELPRIAIPFLIAFFQVITGALAIGLLPAIWVFSSGRHYGLLLRWGIVTAICIGAAAYGLPKAYVAYKTWVTAKGFKQVALIMGYVIGGVCAPFLLPEPYRLAKIRVRHERHGQPQRRRKRRRSSGEAP